MHDGFANDAGKALADRVICGAIGADRYVRLAEGETHEL